MNIKRLINNWIYPAYYLRNRLYYRFDRVDTGLSKYQFHDTDLRMFYAITNLFIEFVEKEYGYFNLGYNFLFETDINRKQKLDDMFILYCYLSFDFKKELKEKTFNDPEFYNKCTKILIKIVELRGSLWT